MSAKVLTNKEAEAARLIRWPSIAGDQVEETYEVPDTRRSHSEPLVTSDSPGRISALEQELMRAKAEADRRVQEALASGRKEGDAAARQNLDLDFQQEVTRMSRLMNDLVKSGSVLRRQAEEDLVRLALAIARRILHREIAVDSEALLGLVKAAMSKVDQREVHTIRVHPDTVPILQQVLMQTNVQQRIEVSADSRLDRGALVIETSRGQLDASVETQLQEIGRGFADIVAAGKS